MRIDGHTHLTRPPENMLKILDATGVDRCVVCSSGLANGEDIHTLQDAKGTMARVAKAQNNPGTGKNISDINREIADVVQSNPERFIGFGKVDLFEEDYMRRAEEVLALGLSGIGEIIGVHGNVEKLAPLAAFSHAHGGFPLFVHCDYPVDGNDLAEIAALCAQNGKAVVIIGHFGGDFWLDAIEIAKRLPGVYLDLSEIVNQVPLTVAAREIPEKLLYGTDAPWDLAEAILVRVQHLPVGSEVKEQILGGNLERILKAAGKLA